MTQEFSAAEGGGAAGARSLADAIPEAEFCSFHAGIVRAAPASVRAAIDEVGFSDLALGRLLFAARGLAAAEGLPLFDMFERHAGAAVVRGRPRYAAVAMVGRPWSPIPKARSVRSLEEVRRFDEPGWLRYGMDWTLTPLEGGRTLLETSTLCEPTSDRARRAFRAYWSVIRPGSALIRDDLIRGIRRRAERAEARASLRPART